MIPATELPISDRPPSPQNASAPTLVLDIALAVICAVIFYGLVVSFDRPTPAYHAEVSYDIIYWASLLLATYFLMPWRRSLPQAVQSRPWLLVAALILLSTLLAEDSFQAWARFRLYYAVVILGFVLWLWFRRGGERITEFILLAIGVTHAAVLMLVVMTSGDADLSDPFNQAWVPYHAHVRHVSYHGMIAACAGLSVALIGGPLRLPGYALAATALFGIAYLGARGAFAGWIVFVIVAIVLLPRRWITLGACVGVVMVAILAAKIASDHWHRSPFTGSLAQRTESISSVVHTTGRTKIWADGLSAVKAKPFVGYGPEGYLSSRCCRPNTVQPHNTVVQILLEFGVLGLLAIGTAIWTSLGRDVGHLWVRRGAANIDRRSATLFATFSGIMAFSLVDGLFYHVVPMTLVAMLAALYASRKSRRT